MAAAVFGTLLTFAPLATAASAKPLLPADQARAERALEQAQDLFSGHNVHSGRELTLALAKLARRKAALPASDRDEAQALLARPTDKSADPQGHGYTAFEALPYCTANFCIHYVTSTADAPSLAGSTPNNPVPDYVKNMANEFEYVHSVENGALGWDEPKSDGVKGTGLAMTDVYIAQIGDEGIYGYAASEENSVSSHAYLVMDNDYAEFSGFGAPIDALRVTAAHEYNHVLQFTYDSLQDLWMLESTAVWAEERVYPAINDYLNFVGTWGACTASPLTAGITSGGSCDLKMYGTGVWNHWLEARYGSDAIRRAFEVSASTTPAQHLAPDAYDEALLAEGAAGFGDEFGRFAAAAAEWKAPGSQFPDNGAYADVERSGEPLAVGAAGRTVSLSHTAFALIDVTRKSSRSAVQLKVDVPAGLDATVALVGRTGPDPGAGRVVTETQRLPNGGKGTVTLANPGGYGRITAVLANADFSQSGHNGSDWAWTRDGQAFQNVQVVSPPPRSARRRLTSRLTLKSPQRIATVLKRGVLASVRCNQACKGKVELTLDRKTARKLGLKRVVATKTVTLKKAGVKSLRLKLNKRARAKLRKRGAVPLTARMRATRGSARSASHTHRLRLRR